jgi:inner membrane protein
MDSLSQVALGAAVGVAVMGRRTAAWKAALWGGLCGTLPDLDAFIDHGDAIRNMTQHRAETHALFWLTLAAPPIAWVVARVSGEGALFRRWWLAVWLALVTHPMLDTMTVYGTQLALPFSDRPYGVGSVFIIDPLYTLPLLVGLALVLFRRDGRGLRWNAAGLVLSTAYLAWGVAAQQHVQQIAEASLRAQGIAAQRVLVTPTAFNSVLWRVVAMEPDAYHEGFHSLLDKEPRMRFDRFARGEQLYRELQHDGRVQRIAWFSGGYFKLWERDGQVGITDLRMGQEPSYTFSFVIAERLSALKPVAPRRVGARPDASRVLPWMWRRMGGEVLPPPR